MIVVGAYTPFYLRKLVLSLAPSIRSEVVGVWLANGDISEWDLWRLCSSRNGLPPDEAMSLLIELQYDPNAQWPLRRYEDETNIGAKDVAENGNERSGR